jgi:hypothetical protein
MPACSLAELPVEIIQRIALYVDPRDIPHLWRTCRRLQTVLAETAFFRERLELCGFDVAQWEKSIAAQNWVSDGRLAVDLIVHDFLELWPRPGQPSQQLNSIGTSLNERQWGRFSILLWIVLAHEGRGRAVLSRIIYTEC